MEPIPQTAELVEEFGEFYDVDLLDLLRNKAEAVRELVPDLVGVSLGSLTDGVAFTLVATDREVAVLDAVQYAVGGPCVDASLADRVVEFNSDEGDDEELWHDFARATAAKAVATTLTLPILGMGRVVGTVNLYAASGGAFRGLHQEIAAIFDAWAPGAVTNADLSFQTRRTAEESAGVLRQSMRVDMAVGVLMESESLTDRTARRLLAEAAQRAGVTTHELAETLLQTFERSEDG